MTDSMNARWLRWSLTAIVVLLTVIALELSVFTGNLTPRAAAQIPDSGMQRKQLLDLQAQTNVRLDNILQVLRAQPIKVTVVGTDKDSKPAPRPAAGGPRPVEK